MHKIINLLFRYQNKLLKYKYTDEAAVFPNVASIFNSHFDYLDQVNLQCLIPVERSTSIPNQEKQCANKDPFYYDANYIPVADLC